MVYENYAKRVMKGRVSFRRASAGEKGNSGRNGAICSEIFPFNVERERLTESFRISLVHSSFPSTGSWKIYSIRLKFC
jgi:hypothetical protein